LGLVAGAAGGRGGARDTRAGGGQAVRGAQGADTHTHTHKHTRIHTHARTHTRARTREHGRTHAHT
jgi:hypothetical protein